MEETTTSWKNHSFTMLVFGGIVVLCSIFFVLGMLVGRTQGQKMAEIAFAAKEAKESATATVTDEFTLNYYSETTAPNPDLTLQPAPERTPPAVTPDSPALGGSSSTAPGASKTKAASVAKTPAAKASPAPKAPATKTPAGKATAKPTTAKTPAKAPLAKEAMLQIVATRNEKTAQAERKKVESKGFTARVVTVTQNGEEWHRVYVGPYKESQVKLAKADLKARGYKDPIERW